ncbi:hypothetical protein FA15DRAFT_676281, partial [Coprinopsis marcescibilis]
TQDTIRCIPDVTIWKLLKQLEMKGRRNVTVILDSCHSGGMRGKEDEAEFAEFRTRNTTPDDRIPFPFDIDSDIWQMDEPLSFGGILGRDRAYESSTLLAACDPRERARDGWFTKSLVELLRQTSGTIRTIAEIAAKFSEIKATDQTPVVLGNPRTILFMPNDIEVDKKVFELEVLGEGRFEVKAGEIHGIGSGALFRYGYGVDLEVDRADMFISSLVLRPPITAVEIPNGARVSAIPAPNSTERISSTKVWLGNSNMGRHIKNDRKWFEIVKDSERPTANVSITLIENDKRVKVDLLDELFVKTGTSTCDFSVSDVGDKLKDLLESIALFRYHLGRRPHKEVVPTFTLPSARTPSIPSNYLQFPLNGNVDPLWSKCSIGLYETLNIGGIRVVKEPPRNLFVADANGGYIANLVNSAATTYGIKLENRSRDTELYFHLFYFHPSDYSIQAWVLGSGDGSKVAPEDSITIGYGSGGGYPIWFRLDDPLRSETGFIKVFVATQPVDGMRIVEQSGVEDLLPRKFIPAKRMIPEKKEWGTFVATIRVDTKLHNLKLN